MDVLELPRIGTLAGGFHLDETGGEALLGRGFGLIVLTVFDVVVMGLIWHEYRLVRHHLTSPSLDRDDISPLVEK